MMKSMRKVMRARTPADELWLHHVASSTVVAGENLAWFYPRAAYRGRGFMARQMVKPDKLWVWTMPRRVGDADTVAACWRRVLAWPARAVMTFHDVVGTAGSTSDGRPPSARPAASWGSPRRSPSAQNATGSRRGLHALPIHFASFGRDP